MKNKSWNELIESFKVETKDLLKDSILTMRTTEFLGYYLELELSQDNKKNKDKIINDSKIVNEILDTVIPWIADKTRSDKFRGIFIIESSKHNNNATKGIEELGGVLVSILTTNIEKSNKDGCNINNDCK